MLRQTLSMLVLLAFTVTLLTGCGGGREKGKYMDQDKPRSTSK